MGGSNLAWLINHKEWAFTVACAVVGGGFALTKWLVSLRKATSGSRPSATLTLNGTANSAALISGGTSIGNLIVGSNNIQNILSTGSKEKVPLAQRSQTSPSGNEIRQRQAGLSKGIPLYLQGETEKSFLASFKGVEVGWLITICEVRAWDRTNDVLRIYARYGEENWGAWIAFELNGTDYPIVKTISDGERAFVTGKIREIEDHGQIVLDVSRLEIE
jgi:hypothetical protein